MLKLEQIDDARSEYDEADRIFAELIQANPQVEYQLGRAKALVGRVEAGPRPGEEKRELHRRLEEAGTILRSLKLVGIDRVVYAELEERWERASKAVMKW